MPEETYSLIEKRTDILWLVLGPFVSVGFGLLFVGLVFWYGGI